MANDIMAKVRRFAGADPDTPDDVLEMCYRAAVDWYKAQLTATGMSDGDAQSFIDAFTK